MKSVFVLLAVLVAVALPVAAQDFSSPNPQYITFNLGVVLGPEFADDGGFAGGSNFGFDFAILDQLTVGFERISTVSNGNISVTRDYNGLRLGYSFTPLIGAALGFGTNGTDDSITLGLFANLLGGRGSYGITHNLKLRVDYVAAVDALDEGALLFIVGYSFGI
jgi:opacity protein-like surface antigen